MTGVVVVVNGQIICADLFGSHKLLSAMWDKILRSYCMEAINSDNGQRGMYVEKEDVQRLLRRARQAGMEYCSTPGTGSLLSINSRQVSGSALVWRNRLLHGDLFPEYQPIPEPPIYREQKPGGFFRDYKTR